MPRRKALETVLVVDDHEDTRTLYATILADAGYTTETASTGHEAIVLARRHKPVVVLMDLAMPVMDGWNATQTLKSAPATRDAWLIVVTARSERHDIDRAYAAGCDAVLLKPVDPEALVQAVRAGVSRASRRRP